MFFTAILSVFAGTIVYAITKFILDSALEQRIIVSDIKFYLDNLSHRFLAPALEEERLEDIYPLMRELSSKLIKTINKVPFYKICQAIRIVHNEENIKKASGLLKGISNLIAPLANEDRIDIHYVIIRQERLESKIEELCSLLSLKM